MDPLVIFLLSVIALLVATLAFLAWLSASRRKEILRLRLALEASHAPADTGKETEPLSISEIRLTQREQEIARLCCEGLLNKEIADRLDISQRTVETHKNNIFHKLGINTTAELKKHYLCNLENKI